MVARKKNIYELYCWYYINAGEHIAMGTWGIDINQDDTFCSVCENFKAWLHTGMKLNSIVDKIIVLYEDEPDKHVAYLAIAECLWHCNQLTSNIYDNVIKIKDKNIDNIYWRSLGANEAMLRKRAKCLDRFIEHLSVNPSKNQMWDLNSSKTDTIIKKGDVFWYKSNGIIYGAVVLDKIKDIYYLIAISESLQNIPRNVNEIISSQLYTVAWFSDIDLLPCKRMHKLSCIEINGNYNHRAGFAYDLDKIIINNCGQRDTWKHLFRSFSWNTIMGSTFDSNKLPYFYG